MLTDVSTPFTAGRAPGALPLLGHAPAILRGPVEFMESLPAHGDLVEIRLGPQRAYVPCHPDLLQQILVEDRVFDKGGPLMDTARDAVGNGLATCPHHDHRRKRRLTQPAFGQAALARYSAVMSSEVAAARALWQDGQVIDAFGEFSRLAVRIVSRTLFSAEIGDDTTDELQHSFKTLSAMIGPRVFVPAAAQRLPLPVNRRYHKAIDHLHDVVDRVMTDCRDGDDAGGLLSVLSGDAASGGADLTPAEIRDEVITMLGAGTESTAAAVCWTLYLLARHPDLRQRLYAEVDTVLAGRTPGHDDLPALEFTRRVVTESLRLCPPLWLLTRVTTAPVTLAGRFLPAGTTIMYSPHAIQRQAAVYPDPRRFDPDRWLPGTATPAPRNAFTVFATGARKCIGDIYATNETIITVAGIAARWQFDCAPGTDSRPAPLSGINHPAKLLLELRPRRAQ
jgi:pentalenene oxygenase